MIKIINKQKYYYNLKIKLNNNKTIFKIRQTSCNRK